MQIIIRQTEKQDYNYTENFTREIFWNLFKSRKSFGAGRNEDQGWQSMLIKP